MPLSSPVFYPFGELEHAHLQKRYKRFMADVIKDDGTRITAHCPNSGSMMGLLQPNTHCWIAPVHNPKAKLSHKWVIASQDDTLVGINTMVPNDAVATLLSKGMLPPFTHFSNFKKEFTYGASRFDFILKNHNQHEPDMLLEVKNVTLARHHLHPQTAEFPDAKTERGTKHLLELCDAIDHGYQAGMLYFVQRGDCTRFQIAKDIDPAYNEAYLKAKAKGVRMFCFTFDVLPQGLVLKEDISSSL